MKLTVLLLFGSLVAHAQYAASASGSTTAAAEINSKPAFQTGTSDPANCTAGKDFFFNTSSLVFKKCTATNTWTPFVNHPINAKTSTYQVLAADFDNCKAITVASGTFTITLVDTATQPAAGSCLWVINYGSGVVTVARSGQNINGGTASLSLPAAAATAPASAFITSNGTDYFANVVLSPALANITGLGTGVGTFLGTPSSANLISAVTDETGTGALVFANTPTLVTPVIGAATGTSLVLTGSLTSNALTSGRIPIAGTSGILADDADLTFATDTLTATKIVGSTSITDSGLTSGRVTFAGASGILSDDADLTFATDTLTATKMAATTSLTVGGAAITNNVVQNSQSAAYTTVLGDAGKHIYHPGADTTARTWTIDSNANVAYPIGTTLTFVNDTSAGVITIAITSDTLVWAAGGGTGSRTLAASSMATAVKITSTRWMISGTSGLT